MNKGRGNRNFIILLSVIFVILIITIIIAATINSRIPKNTAESVQNAEHLSIENFESTAPDIPKFYQTETENSIWQILNKFNDIGNDTYATAEIRSDSYQEEARDSVKHSEFIVDIPELKHSFRVSFNWINSNNPDEYDINIECPDAGQIIYKDTVCYTNYDPISSLAPFLPTKIDKNAILSIKRYSNYNSTRPNKQYLSIDADTCSADAKKILEKKVNAWLQERDQDPRHFYIEYSILCNGRTL